MSNPVVIAVSSDPKHNIVKPVRDSIRLIAGWGIDGDAHAGKTVQHRYDKRKNPEAPNLRQVHLMHAELFDQVKALGLDVQPGQMGENITTRGIDLLHLPRRTQLKIGEAIIVVTGLRNPCKYLNQIAPGLMKACISKHEEGTVFPQAGVMGIVVTDGEVRAGDIVSGKYDGPDIRIALVTDIHINGLHVPPSRVLDIVEAINNESPDVVLIPGDFVSGHDRMENRTDVFNAHIALGISSLGQITAPTFATIGNHDAWWDAGRVTTHLEEAGITVLENQATVIGAMCLVGLADYWTSQPERSAYDDCPSNAAPLVFTHSPDAWQAFRSDSVLALAGHTHGLRFWLRFRCIARVSVRFIRRSRSPKYQNIPAIKNGPTIKANP